jgi:serine/threonine protein kinase
LGNGSFGIVYSGMLNKKGVAIKVLNGNVPLTDVQNEIRAMRKLQHENIVKVRTVTFSVLIIKLVYLQFHSWE